MIQKRRIAKNALSSMAQVLVMSCVLFYLYRFILEVIGAEQLGIWSIVLATTSVTRFADLGLSGSVVKFVAQYVARGQSGVASEVVQTAFLFSAVTVGLVLLLGFPLMRWLLTVFVPSHGQALAVSILPFALLSLWLNVMGGMFLSGLDGQQHIATRNGIVIAWAVAFLIMCIVLTPRFGLLGLAYAQVIQSCGLLLSGWFFLRRRLPSFPFIPTGWNRLLLREMMGYGVNFQISSGVQMLYDPTTKALLAKFGGLSLVAFFEMASRMVVQIRAFIISANQTLVPTIAVIQEQKPDQVQDLYKDSARFLLFVAIPVFLSIGAFAPLISEYWLGYYEPSFVVFAWLMGAAWFANALSVPAYFANLGIGKIRWNTIAHVVIGALNIVLGFVLGLLYDGWGVVIGWALALALGSQLLIAWYHRKYEMTVKDILVPPTIRMAIVGFAATAACLLSFYLLRDHVGREMGLLLAVFLFAVPLVLPIVRHPLFTRILHLVRANMPWRL